MVIATFNAMNSLAANAPKRPAAGTTTRKGLSASRGGGGGIGYLPYTEEDLNLNVRRALKDLRKDFKAPPDKAERQTTKVTTGGLKGPSPSTATGTKGCSVEKTPAPIVGPSQYVVDCVDGKILVKAIPTSSIEATTSVGTAGIAHVQTPSPRSGLESSTKLPVVAQQPGPFVNAHPSFSGVPSSSLVPSSCAQNTALVAQPLMFSADASCSSSTYGESEIIDFGGIGLESIASWAQSPADHCTPHPKYYFPDGTLVLLVEDSLYKIHHHFFERYSSFFVAVFTSLKFDSSMIRASTSSLADSAIQLRSPIYLPDITTIEFDRLLSIIYPSSFAACDITSTEEWLSILNLSCKLEFASIRELAINNTAPKVSVIDKALLGKRYGIKAWVVDAYSELCTRERPLSIEEGRRLGVDLVIKVNELRHELFFSAGAGTSIGMGISETSLLDLGPRTASACNMRVFEELPERVAQHFKLHTMDDGAPEDEGIYFKAVLDENQ